MKRLTIYNKLFIVFCVAMICFIAVTVPHEKDTKGSKKQSTENVEKDKL
ncbi:MAG: hypothetical protein IPN88_08030 [Bacteroidetes bacterium]|nr:hypothetical protein [Bacteroidota bacterium]